MTYGMRSLAIVLAVSTAVLLAPPIAAQDNAERERQARAGELEAERNEARAKAVEARLREAEQRNEARAETIEVQLREAEEKLAEAAAQVAELSRRRLDVPTVASFQRYIDSGDRPVLGVTIGADNDDGPVEGVTIRGVTPGSAAAEAGLRAGDVLTAVNDESLSAGSPSEANEKLLEFMSGVEEGDTLDVEYLRDGDTGVLQVKPRAAPGFAHWFGDRWRSPMAPIAPAAPGVRWFGFHGGGSWGDMEMVALTEELGRYFGTSSGLLVVRAPEDENLKLQDGDVIQRIDGREPTSVSHAMRILGSYQSGETLDIEIMRDRKRETLSIEMPDHRQGHLRRFEFRAPPVEFRQEIEREVRESAPADRI